jgi:transcriptional antiterminator RfaH
MKRWYVVYTQHRTESRAVAQLRQQGFKVYFPRCRKIRRHARREDVVQTALFPRYLFVAFDLERDQWRSVNGTIGVSHMISHGERPMALPDDVVPCLRANETEDGLVSLATLALFDPGAKLRVLDGAFVGQAGIYDGMTGADRVVLLFDLIGRQVRVSVPIHAVEAA